MNVDSNSKLSHLSDRIQTLQMFDQHCQYMKDGKLFYNETKLRTENHICVAEKIIFFRVFRASLENNPEAIKKDGFDIPHVYADLIAALVQDSDEGLSELSYRIDSMLSPFQRNEELASYFIAGIEKSIRQVAALRYYGLSEDVFITIQHNKLKIPWHLTLHRWEVHDISLFPPDMQQIVNQRRQQREQMSFVFSSYINNLSASEKEYIVNTKQRRTPAFKEIISIEDDANTETDIDKEEKRKKKEEEKRKKEEEKRKKEEEKRKKEEEKKLRDEQREEEKKQREEEKRQREEEKRLREEEKKRKENEKKKKEQTQLRLTSLFTKTTPMEKHTKASNIENASENTKPSLFPPFYKKENVTLSKVNKFLQDKPTNFNDFMKHIQYQNTECSRSAYLKALDNSSKQKRGTSTHIDIHSLLLPGAADILHNPNVKLALSMKLLQYSEDVRPAYYGTFTKKSNIISGRTPLAKDDNILDYNVDSEGEWEPEGEGEDIHSDEDDDDPNADMIDPEDANWLVPEGYLSDNEGIEDKEGNSDNFKHKSQSSRSSKRVAVRKVVLGPFFQGEGDEDEIMKPFELQFLVDSPFGFGYDPFYKEPPAPKIPTTSIDNSFTDEHKSALINVINGKADSIPALVSEAKSNWILRDVSKRQLEAKIKDIAIKEKRGSDTKPAWYLKQHGSS